MKKKQLTGRFSAMLLLFVMATTGCSIKEDRMPCPCFLNVSFSDRDAVTAPVTLVGWDDKELFRETVDIKDHDPYWIKAVHKGKITLGVFSGVRNARASGKTVTMPAGVQCDSLYAYYTDVDCTDEMAYAEATLRKQFATVRVDINKTFSQMKEDYTFSVEGNTVGFNVTDFSPVEGTFRCNPVAEGRTVDFRIPRQKDGDLIFEIKHKNSAPITFPLGKYILRTGYNWNAEELQDVFISIDLVISQIQIYVAGWESGATFNFVEQ